jgi:hypothetical protein
MSALRASGASWAVCEVVWQHADVFWQSADVVVGTVAFWIVHAVVLASRDGAPSYALALPPSPPFSTCDLHFNDTFWCVDANMLPLRCNNRCDEGCDVSDIQCACGHDAEDCGSDYANCGLCGAPAPSSPPPLRPVSSARRPGADDDQPLGLVIAVIVLSIAVLAVAIALCVMFPRAVGRYASFFKRRVGF